MVSKKLLLTLIASCVAIYTKCSANANANAPERIPGFKGATAWLRGKAVGQDDLRGKVVLVDFYTSRCSNCLAAVPHISELHRRYKDRGLVVVGVHTPEFEEERDPKLIEKTAQRLGVEYPVAIDNDHAIWNLYHNQYWPNLMLFDKTGKLVYAHAGEGDYEQTEQAVQALCNAPTI
ncbi:MAG: redoxin domain-containing protein [Candidatus Melainabacteria bacterium]|nr:MAG: redoxin domain-containing protein [Candidatus Melainabacteria bacterium]